MNYYTLNEATAEIKLHRLKTDYRKLIREAVNGKFWLLTLIHGYHYSPTIKSKCELVISKYLNVLLGIEKQLSDETDEISIKFDDELRREVLDDREFLKLTKDEKTHFLIEPSQTIKKMIERYSNPSLGGYFAIPPKQLINFDDGVCKIGCVIDGKEMYFLSKDVKLEDLLIDEYSLKKYIESLSDIPKTTKRQNQLYTEITEFIPDYLDLSSQDIIVNLMNFAGKEDSCVIKVERNTVYWRDKKNLEQSTNYQAIEKWLSRQKKT